jgi:outer membrane protein assembly factor BamB/predicted phosphodiesterase
MTRIFAPRFYLLWFILMLVMQQVSAQPAFQFAEITDLHIGSQGADEDLRRTVHDINLNPEIKFVIASGDITEFGSDDELKLAKQILDSLNKPWYIIPGNHDDNWSESGTNSFIRIFGSETFSFRFGGYYFMGNNCGPNMKMSPGQVPYENIVWMDSVLKTVPAQAPVIFVNHYPLDSSLNNWYELADRLKARNTQLYLCGHGHQNRALNFEGIPAAMCRSNLRARDSVGGYNIITFEKDSAFFRTRLPGVGTKEVWLKVPLKNHHYKDDTKRYPRPSYKVNEQFPQVRELWRYQDSSDIGSGMAVYKNLVITPDAKGRVIAFNPSTGKIIWRFSTGGKIYSTPAIEKNKVIIPSTDGTIYCLNAENGSLFWKTSTPKSIVASPVIKNNHVFLGSSEGRFRALDLQTGKLAWSYDSVKGFMKSQPLIYQNRIYFGAWGNEVYCLDAASGKLIWKYADGYSNRMFSPASCVPVATNGRIFIVAPDRFMTALDAETGKLIWKHKWNEHWVRESMGLSADSSLVFAKTMQGKIIGVDTRGDSAVIRWETPEVFGYELNPSVIFEYKGKVYALGDKGLVAAFDRKTGATLWLHKVSNSLVNDIKFLNDQTAIVTTMDGKWVMLSIPK